MTSFKSTFVFSILLSSQAFAANVFDAIAQENLQAVPAAAVVQDKPSETLGEKQFFQEMQEKLTEQFFATDKRKKRALVYRLFSEYEQAHPSKTPNVIDTTTWQDLEMLCGPRSAPAMYSAASLDRTSTEAGRAVFYRRLIQPTDDVQLLRQRQDIVKELIKNEGLFEDLEAIIKPLAASENLLLSFWDDDIFSTLVEQKKLSVPFLPQLSDMMNKSPLVKEFYSKLELVTMGVSQLALTGSSILLGMFVASKFGKGFPEEKLLEYLAGFGLAVPVTMAPYAVNGLYKKYGLEQQLWHIVALVGSGAAVMCALDAYNMRNQIKSKTVFDMAIQTKLLHVARLLDAAKVLCATVRRHDALTQALPELAGLDGAIDGIKNISHDFKKLLDHLKKDTFHGKATITSYTGRVIAAYQLMLEQRDRFVFLLKALGELDAHLSVARLCKEFEGERVRFCFPTYLEGDAPSLALSDTWNPVIDRKKVVANSCHLGGDATRNLIITGPNAGGKSTYMKSVALSAICAQTIGLAPARTMTFTPFSKIRTYLNIIDDLAAGNSYFKAGVIRARQLLDTVQDLKPGQRSLSIIDEVFNGTTFTEGQAAAYSYTKLMGSFCGNLMLTSTHFPAIADLTYDMGDFANARVTVTNKPGEKLCYPYTIEPGISPQVITLQVLAEEGFGEDFLNDAQTCLSRLVKSEAQSH